MALLPVDLTDKSFKAKIFDKENNKWIKNRELTSDFFSYDSEYTLLNDEEYGRLKK